MKSNEMSPMPLQSPEEDSFEYTLLTGHYRSDRTYKTDDQLRTEYLRNTDELIRQITDGVLVQDPETGEQTVEKPDAVVFLDKSARPVRWLMAEMWDKHAADAEGNLPEMPKTYFANIDREQWVNNLDPQGVGSVDVDRVDASIIRSLRSIYVSPTHKINHETGQDELTENIDTAPAVLDGKTILIVDEVYSSGRTLNYATKFFKRAFPTAKVASTYWMGGIAQRGQAQGNADLPVWYKDKDPTGRGVANRNEKASQLSPSRTQRLGAWFLSTAFKTPDPASRQLRKELRQLAHDPNVLIEPSRKRSEDDYDERV